MASIEEIEKRRADRKAKLREAEDAQKAIDLEALDACEEAHGDTSVCFVEVPYTPGLPTMVIGRMPRPVELKCYRQSIKVAGKTVDIQASNEAADTLGKQIRIYPEAEVFEKMCAARPDIASMLGARGTKLAQGKAIDKGEE